MPGKLPTITQTPSANFGDRRGQAVIDMLIIHFTDQPDLQSAVDILTDPNRAVSAHYLIAADGRILQLVNETDRAWHAGVAFWAGEHDINSRSIGIELDNPGIDTGVHPYPAAQMQSLQALAIDILCRHPIPARHVLGHSDVAPGRKQDPGPLFDWQRLAAAGVGLWPKDWPKTPVSNEFDWSQAADLLARIGYDPALIAAAPAAVVSAFQSHWRAANIDGQLDAQTAAHIASIAAMVEADKSL
ncbi:MAG: N-acetylmuramoyl-L-alanine amidase [Rhodospirillaceae bacterium]